MPATRKSVVDQPRQQTLSRRLISIGKVLANYALPGAERFDALFDESTIGALMTGGPRRALIFHVGQRRETETLRSGQRPDRFGDSKKLNRFVNRAPTFLGGEGFPVGSLVLFANEQRPQLFEI